MNAGRRLQRIWVGIKKLIVRIAAKAGINRIEKLHTLSDWPEQVVVPDDVVVELLSSDRLASLGDQGDLPVSAEDRARVETGIAFCVGAFVNGEYAGCGWYALKPYHHSDGLYAFFDAENWVCGYGARVAEAFRGRSIRTAIVHFALKHAKELGRKGILAAINWDNEASLRSGKKLGYRPVGYQVWWPLRPHRTHPLYYLSYVHKPVFDFPAIAVMTPFHSLILDEAFATTQLQMLVDCSDPEAPSWKARLKHPLYRLTGRDDSLKAWAIRRGIAYVRYERKQPDALATELERSGIELLLSYGAPLLPESVFATPSLGTLNLHPSRLPDYRGGRPLFWQCFDGNLDFGVTLHEVNAGIDRGRIIQQQGFHFDAVPDRYTLSLRARAEAAQLLHGFLWDHLRKGLIPAQAQEQSSATRFARQVNMNQLLEEFSLPSLNSDQIYRTVSYLGFWPIHFHQLSGFPTWHPVTLSRVVDQSEAPRPDVPAWRGFVWSDDRYHWVFYYNFRIRAMLQRWRDRMALNRGELPDIYL